MNNDRFDDYTEHRTGAEMQALLHHGHWVPVLSGRTTAFVAEHFPGWTWNGLLEVCRAAGIVVEVEGGVPLRCHPHVRAFHFSDSSNFAVEWDRGPGVVEHGSESR